MAIIVEQIDKSGHVLHLHKIEGATATLGRAFDNDIILQDASVDAYHGTLSWDETQRQLRLQDRGALNGLWSLNGRGKKSRIIGTAALQSGQPILLGKTLLRVYESSHPVPPAKPVRVDEAITGFLSHFWVMLPLAVLAIGLDILNQYFDQPVGQHYGAFAVEAGYGLLSIASYAGFWALLGRSLLHDGRYSFHLGLSFLLVNLWLLAAFFAPWLIFNLHLSNGASVWLGKLIACLLGGGGIYAACLYATRLSLKPRLALALIVPLALLTPLVAKLFDHSSFNNRPDYSHTLVSPGGHWRSPGNSDDFLQRAQAAYKTYNPSQDEDLDDASEVPDETTAAEPSTFTPF